jgi:hypothetical protein
MSQGRWTETKAIDPEHSNVDPDEEAARNRNTLLSYFNDIASIPTLTKEEEVMLAKEMESATHEMRSGILSVSFTWREAIDIWRGLQTENRVTAKMSRPTAPALEGEERGEKLDKCLKKVEALLARTTRSPLPERKTRSRSTSSARASRRRPRGGLSMQIFERIRRKLRGGATRWRATSGRSAT